ncbi:sulfotransferase [Actibacterium ureilyticum]|uniref:sulfotransferase n=1 Tax=Actibacterium ureilyticum TaxID=1590614 RepID=UPI000BAAA012|nr:sulfotransferase [Actibacterium ureilyticum]
MGDAVLMFGMGATKAGTSWLYRYLAGHPDCHLRSVKELHYFDTLDFGNRAGRAKALRSRHAELAGRRGGDGATRAARMADLAALADLVESGNDDAYLAYLNAGRKQERLVGDMTPAYALLSEGRLRQMAGMAAQVRFIYLMRDPVERLWSHVRMIARRRSPSARDIAGLAGALLGRVLSGAEDHIAARGDYRAVLGRIDRALDPRQVFLAFSEDLFSGAVLDKLCAFLGIGARSADLTRAAHVGVPVEMNAVQRAEAAAWLKPQYDFVAARMGRLPAAWEANTVGV